VPLLRIEGWEKNPKTGKGVTKGVERDRLIAVHQGGKAASLAGIREGTKEGSRTLGKRREGMFLEEGNWDSEASGEGNLKTSDRGPSDENTLENIY